MPKAKRKSKTTSNRPAQRRLRVQRVVSRRPLTSTEVVQEIMFLLGVEYVAKRKYDKAVQMVRHIWRDGYAIGVEMQNRKPATLKKIKAILSGKEKAANEKGQR